MEPDGHVAHGVEAEPQLVAGFGATGEQHMAKRSEDGPAPPCMTDTGPKRLVNVRLRASRRHRLSRARRDGHPAGVQHPLIDGQSEPPAVVGRGRVGGPPKADVAPAVAEPPDSASSYTSGATWTKRLFRAAARGAVR